MIRYESTHDALWSFLRFRRIEPRVVGDFGQPFLACRLGTRTMMLVSENAHTRYSLAELNVGLAHEVARVLLGHWDLLEDQAQRDAQELERKRVAARLLMREELVARAFHEDWNARKLAMMAGVTDELAAMRLEDYKFYLLVIKVRHRCRHEAWYVTWFAYDEGRLVAASG
jgi:hypothetical protein